MFDLSFQEKEQMCKENVNKIAKKYKQQPPHEMDRTRLREFKTIISAIKKVHNILHIHLDPSLKHCCPLARAKKTSFLTGRRADEKCWRKNRPS